MFSLPKSTSLVYVLLSCTLLALRECEASILASQFKCQSLRSHNQTKILCEARPKVEEMRQNREQYAKNGRVCHKLFQLSQRLEKFEEGQMRYCDPARCLRESPSCKGGKMTAQCTQCLGKCWLMYGYPVVTAANKLQFKTFPCDPTNCGKNVFCGGYDMRNGHKSAVM